MKQNISYGFKVFGLYVYGEYKISTKEKEIKKGCGGRRVIFEQKRKGGSVHWEQMNLIINMSVIRLNSLQKDLIMVRKEEVPQFKKSKQEKDIR